MSEGDEIVEDDAHVECHDDLSLYGQSLFIALTFLTNSVLAKFALRHAAQRELQGLRRQLACVIHPGHNVLDIVAHQPQTPGIHLFFRVVFKTTHFFIFEWVFLSMKK